MVTVKRLIEEGRIGDMRLVRTSFSFTIDPSDWRMNPGQGPGALWDLGCYGVNVARLLRGRKTISAEKV